jgi:predicted metal-dependent enzyme (double-stranded beta helix superfamily)
MFGAISVSQELVASGEAHSKPWTLREWRERNERAAVERLARLMADISEYSNAPLQIRQRVLQEVAVVARHVDLSRAGATPDRYGRRVLREESSGWSLAAVTLRYGQATEAHDHNGWGCAVTVQGIERDRRFVIDGGELVPIDERDYHAGEGYLFEMSDIHQPVGADPDRDTVALHFLYLDHGIGAVHQQLHEGSADPDGHGIDLLSAA